MPQCNVLFGIILIPAFHFTFSIFLVGVGFFAILQDRLGVRDISPPGKILVSTCLGILYNAVQFALVLTVYKALPVHSQFYLSIGKYAMDMLFLLLVRLVYRSEFLPVLKSIPSMLSSRGNAALLLFSLILGMAAVLNFPHVHDSGQLMATNCMLQSGADFLSAERYGLGYSALCYFPTVLIKSIPMGTLASGYKIFILLLAGLAAIYGVDRLALAHRVTGMFLLLVIIMSSFFGLYGIMELGKDSAWGVLLSVVFIFSLFGRSRGQKAGESLTYFFGAMVAGMIAIPYLLIFCSIWILISFSPEKVSSHKMLLPAAVILLLGCGAMLMPVRLAIPASPHMQPEYGKYVYWPPTDGKTSFMQYFFAYKKLGYRNSAPLIIAGLLGILLLPLAGERFRDSAIRSMALFLPIATLGSLALAFLARDFLPAQRGEKIPLTPLSTQRVWDLVKDIPQWYLQIISGIFFILLLDALVRKTALAHKARRKIFMGISLVAAGACLSANFSMITALRVPAHFYSYGGNKNESLALVLEIIHRNPGVKHVFLENHLNALNTNWFYFDVKNYFPGISVYVIQESSLAKSLSLLPPGTSLLFVKQLSVPKLQAWSKRRGIVGVCRLAHFPKTGEGIFLVTSKRYFLRSGRMRRP